MVSARSKTACDACRYRKVKCCPSPEAVGCCIGCAQQGFWCTFNLPRARRGPKGKGKRFDLLRRLQPTRHPPPVQETHPASPPPVTTRENAGTSLALSLEQSPPLSLLSSSSSGHALLPSDTAEHAASDDYAGIFADPALIHRLAPETNWLQDFLTDPSQSEPLFQAEASSPTQSWRDDDMYAAFRRMVAIYPLITLDRFKRDFEEQYHSQQLQTFVSALRIASQAVAYRENPHQGTHLLRESVRETLDIRSSCDYSASPNVYCVYVAVVLFIAHSVLDEQNRALLYLSEAVALNSLLPSNATAADRFSARCAELAIFNTEMATIPLYVSAQRRSTIHRAPVVPSSLEALLEEVGAGADEIVLSASERQSLNVVIRLSQVYNAATGMDGAVQILERVIQDDVVDSSSATGYDVVEDAVRTQFVDCKVTALWQLSNLFTSHHTISSLAREGMSVADIFNVLCRRSLEALGWTLAIPVGSLRIIGLAKLTAIARNVMTFHQCASVFGIENPDYQSVVLGLAHCVIQGDYEQKYSDLFAPSYAAHLFKDVEITALVSEHVDEEAV
ncbi:hypothetical protein BD324DRAFT_651442 [Kockovaella imperatae]|uniref:Zn(2)-C6 fungal-type domain-containing protein n=1 Tax=Kockovaella imperatae TaxID=4999 RepID=A0A1Y1UG63_9TREE|nr:hypothetical protein BD324DRAFT_651442 [Kockovaella imperatae]ORX36969.1 hypothetical protein BD324DRAFT_651442 [Kockovaella imperatae]